jgi:hypothetical protein
MSNEIIFEVTEDPVDGGYVASALGVGITTEADTLEELRLMVRDAVDCHFVQDLKASGLKLKVERISEDAGFPGFQPSGAGSIMLVTGTSSVFTLAGITRISEFPRLKQLIN